MTQTIPHPPPSSSPSPHPALLPFLTSLPPSLLPSLSSPSSLRAAAAVLVFLQAATV